MYLKKICVKNFRVFDEIGIEAVFDKGVNALIGENNSGKSSLIDALRIAFSTVPYKKDIFFNKSDFHVNDDGTVAKYAQFDIYLEEVPPYLIEIWDPDSKTGGEFHIRFSLHVAANGMEKVKSTYWGGSVEGNILSPETFEAIEVAFLGALRDSENEMKPSRTSKLAQLLRNIIPDEKERNDLVKLLQDANTKILEKEQILKARDTVNANLLKIEQEVLRQQIDIGLIEPRFDSIASSLRAWVKPRWVLILKQDLTYCKINSFFKANIDRKLFHESEKGIYIDSVILTQNIELEEEIKQKIKDISSYPFELRQNGLGYNNLLFMSAVLGDMSIEKLGICHNLLLIEEPEAHLHPQLQELVHSFFKTTEKKSQDIQVIYTSHSPTLISRIGVDRVNLLYEANHRACCLPLIKTNLTDTDKIFLEKYLDVTKSQMFFAKGILFVEGICEALLIPEMAKLLGRPFDKYAVEVVNLSGVAFKPFVNLFTAEFAQDCFNKIAIITDDDRCTDKSKPDSYISKDLDFYDISDDIVKKIDVGLPSERYTDIKGFCVNTPIELFGATKTLEYALCSCENNINLLIKAIINVFPNVGKTLEEKLKTLLTAKEKATCIWLFIRNRDSNKGAIAQGLCKLLEEQREKLSQGLEVENKFEVPGYIREAIYNVTEK